VGEGRAEAVEDEMPAVEQPEPEVSSKAQLAEL